MKRLVLLALPLALAACGQKDGSSNSSTPAPVAAASAPAGKTWADVVSRTDEGYVMGNPNAPLKLVEYGARSCPTCGALGREGFGPLTDKYVSTGKVSFEFRDFLVHGAPDLVAALVGYCGGAEPFFPLLEQTYAIQNDTLDKLQKVTPAEQQALQGMSNEQQLTRLAEIMGMIDFAKQRGLPEAKTRACLADKAMIDKLAKNTDAKSQDGTVSGTPTLILNGRKLDGVTNWQGLESELKSAGA